MKASELIEKLQYVIDEKGDVPVYVVCVYSDFPVKWADYFCETHIKEGIYIRADDEEMESSQTDTWVFDENGSVFTPKPCS